MNMPIAPAAAGTTPNPMTAGASPAAASPLGGFEALLAALFPGEGGQVASPFVKSAQSAEGDAPAQGADDQGTSGVSDPAAQALVAAFAMAPAPAALITAQPAMQGEAAGALGAAGSNVLPVTAQIVPAEGVPTDGFAAQAAPGQTDSKEALLAPPTGLSAIAPGSGLATTAEPAAAAVLPTDGEPAPQDPLADPALQTAKADPAAAPSNQPAAQTPAGSQTAQLAAVHLPPQKPAAGQDQAPDAQSSASTVEGVGDPEATSAPDAAASKTAAMAEVKPGARKLERMDAQTQPSAQQPDTAPQSTHAPAAPEAAHSGATAHAPPAHAASLRGAPETVATLAAEILKKLDSRTTRFDMELEPHGLGKVDVRLEIGAQGRLTAAMAFENPQSAQELKSRSGELIRALEQAGFDVSDGLSFDVADNPHGSGQNNGGAQEQAQDAPWRGRAFLAALQTAGSADTPPIAPMNLARLRASGVDIKI